MKFNRANFLFILISFAFFKFSIGLTNRKFTTTNTTSTTKTTTTSKQKFQKILPKSQSCPYGSNGAYCDECGLQHNTVNLKIVGGIEATPNSWPSIALMVFNYTFSYTTSKGQVNQTVTAFCGGSLIDRETVLTASHCYIDVIPFYFDGDYDYYYVKPNKFHDSIESAYTIYLGLHNKKGIFDGTSNLGTGIKVPIKKFIKHPNYDSSTQQNDIAIIKLAHEVNLTNNIRPACLPNSNTPVYPKNTNIPVWAAGWGTLEQGGATPDNLNNVKMTLYPPVQCRNVSSEIPKDWSKQICAGEKNGGKDTCQGDSGGPLFVKDTIAGKLKFVLAGLTSYGDGCAEKGYPGIYTRVSAYLPWISGHSSRSFIVSNPTTKRPPAKTTKKTTRKILLTKK